MPYSAWPYLDPLYLNLAITLLIINKQQISGLLREIS